MTTAPGPQRELALIQLWETLSTIAKAVFFFLVTPVLIARLGREGYGLLAISFSVVSCVLVFDFGIRSSLRVVLSAMPRGDEQGVQRMLAQSVAALLCVQLLFMVPVVLAGRAGWWSRWLGLGPQGDTVIIAAAIGSLIFALSLLLVEPLAARRQLSLMKLASFIGNALSVPLVLGLAHFGASALSCSLGYVAALTVPNLLVVLFCRPRTFAALLLPPTQFHPHQIIPPLIKGRWFALFAVLWLMRSYLITFLISALFGPAEAGVFFILLKLSELLSTFGANASETAIADLSAADTPIAERRAHFLASYRTTLATSVVAFAGLASVMPLMIEEWFHLPSRGAAIGVFVGGFGLAGGFTRVVAAACMGLGFTRSVALWGLIETAIVLGGAWAFQPWLGLASTFGAGMLASLALVAPARRIARGLEESATRLWLKPALGFFVGIGLSATCAVIANSLTGWPRWGWIAAACACGGAIGAHYLRRLHAGTP